MKPFGRCTSALLLLTTLGTPVANAQENDARAEMAAALKRATSLQKEGKHAEALLHYKKATDLAAAVFGPNHRTTANLIFNLGNAYFALQRFADAKTQFRRSLAILEGELGKEHPDLARVLARLGSASHRLGLYKESLASHLRCLKIEEAHLAKDDAKLAITLFSVGLAYSQLDQHEEALRYLQQSAAILESRPGMTHPQLPITLLQIGSAYVALGQYLRAETYVLRGKKLLEAKLGKDHLFVARGQLVLGHICDKLGRYQEAERHLAACLRIRESALPKNHPDIWEALSHLAALYATMGRYQEAEAGLRRCLQITDATGGPGDPRVAATLNDLGHVYHRAGRLKEAESHFRRSLAIREAEFGKDHPKTSAVLNNLGLLLIHLKQYREAEDCLLRSIKIQETVRGKEHWLLARTKGNLAAVYRGMNRLQEAESLYRDSLKVLEAHFGKQHPHLCPALHSLGVASWHHGDFEQSEALLARCAEINERNWGTDGPQLAATLNCLAGVYQASDKPAEALTTQERCMRVVQARLKGLFAFSSERAMHENLFFFNDDLPAMVSLARVNPEATTAALDWTLRRKGIVFDTLCRYRQIQAVLRTDESLTQKAQRYRELKERVANSILNPPKGLAGEERERELTRWRGQADEIETELNRALASRLPAEKEADITAAALHKRLLPGSALVEFVRVRVRKFKDSSWLPPRYLAFVLVAGTEPARMVDLGAAKSIEAGVAKLRAEFADFQEKLRECESEDDIRDLEKKQEPQFKRVSLELYNRLFAPIKKILGSTRLVYLVPDGDLNRLPFEALVDGQGKYLAEEQRFSYLASGRDLLRDPVKPARGTVAFTNPAFNLGPSDRQARAGKLLAKKVEVAAIDKSTPAVRSLGWKALPGAAGEAEDIKRLLDGSDYGPVKNYAGPEALEEVLKSLEPPRVLHLATHGFFLDHAEEEPSSEIDIDAGAGAARRRLRQDANPLLRSGIVLAGANTLGEKGAVKGVEDGWVTAEEIALLNLRGTELVVLSACQTGLGDIKTGEGVFGLRRAFLFAGAQSLLTSLFEVPDTETRELMKRFYQGLRDGRGKLASLHAAQHDLIGQRRQANGAAHPFFWASFILVGDTE